MFALTAAQRRPGLRRVEHREPGREDLPIGLCEDQRRNGGGDQRQKEGGRPVESHRVGTICACTRVCLIQVGGEAQPPGKSLLFFYLPRSAFVGMNRCNLEAKGSSKPPPEIPSRRLTGPRSATGWAHGQREGRRAPSNLYGGEPGRPMAARVPGRAVPGPGAIFMRSFGRRRVGGSLPAERLPVLVMDDW